MQIFSKSIENNNLKDWGKWRVGTTVFVNENLLWLCHSINIVDIMYRHTETVYCSNLSNIRSSIHFCTLLYDHSSIAIILMGKRELIALLNLSSWCLVMVERLFLAMPRGCLQFVIVVFPDHTHLLFFIRKYVLLR